MSRPAPALVERSVLGGVAVADDDLPRMLADGDALAVPDAAERVGERLHAAAVIAVLHARGLEARGIEAVPREEFAHARVAGAADAMACRVGRQKLRPGSSTARCRNLALNQPASPM